MFDLLVIDTYAPSHYGLEITAILLSAGEEKTVMLKKYMYVMAQLHLDVSVNG